MNLNFSGLFNFGNDDQSPPPSSKFNFDPTDFNGDQSPPPSSKFNFDPFDPSEFDPEVFEGTILDPNEPIGEPDKFYKEYWNAYQGWHASIGQEYESKVHSELARLGASGLKTESTEWNRAVGHLDTWYQEEVAEIQDSDTYRALTRGYLVATALRSKPHTYSLSAWYGRAFNNPLEEPQRIIDRGGVSDVFTFDSEDDAMTYLDELVPPMIITPFTPSRDKEPGFPTSPLIKASGG